MPCRRILFMGSIVIDHVMYVDKLPMVGQSVMTDNFHRFPGGKGSNQAVTAARFGGECHFFGRIGTEAGSLEMLSLLEKAGIAVGDMLQSGDVSAGMCIILVERESGRNMIVFDPAATLRLTPEDVRSHREVFHKGGILALTMEFQRETVYEAIRTAHAAQMEIMLDPLAISAKELPPDIPPMIEFIKPNETEASALTGIEVKDLDSAKDAALALRKMGFKTPIISLGEQGLVALRGEAFLHLPRHCVAAVDSTAAGDVLIGSFLAAYSKSGDFESALRLANAAAALSTTRMGAQTSIPTPQETKAFIAHCFG